MPPRRDPKPPTSQNNVHRSNAQERQHDTTRQNTQTAPPSHSPIVAGQSAHMFTLGSNQALARHTSVREVLPYRRMAPERSIIGHIAPPSEKPQFDWKSCREDCFRYIYDRKKKTVCERTWKSWLYIFIYSIMYVIFLFTCTMMLLYAALSLIKYYGHFPHPSQIHYFNANPFVRNGVGLSAIPAAIKDNALISYRADDNNDYKNYSNTIDKLLRSRKKDLTNSLGPCGYYPYGYGDKPCVIISVNAGSHWWAEPLSPNSTLTQFAPEKVKQWIRSGGRNLWLHCDGYNPVDQENLGEVTYYPEPPGLNPGIFPLQVDDEFPIVAVQFTNYRKGVKIIVQCKLWYEGGPSSVFFMLHVEPGMKYNISSTGTYRVENTTSPINVFSCSNTQMISRPSLNSSEVDDCS